MHLSPLSLLFFPSRCLSGTQLSRPRRRHGIFKIRFYFSCGNQEHILFSTFFVHAFLSCLSGASSCRPGGLQVLRSCPTAASLQQRPTHISTSRPPCIVQISFRRTFLLLR